jgi:transposase
VPPKIAYDNTTVAVKKVLEGPNRELTTEFLRLESHLLFTYRFCRVAWGNEKGHVESLVGYHPRNFLVPVPNFERLETDRVAMLGFPKTAFESRKVIHAKANSIRLVRFGRNDYSAPTAYAHQDVVIIGGVESVKIVWPRDIS